MRLWYRNLWRWLLLFQICIAVQTSGDDMDISAKVPSLTSHNFTVSVSHGVWFIMFHAPWCGHCQRLKPVFARLSEAPELKIGKTMKLALVDCTAEKSLCEQAGAHGYPTFRYYVDSQMHDYKGVRELSPWREFVKRVLHPVTTTIADTDAFEKFIDPSAKAVSFVWFIPKEDQTSREMMALVQLRAAGFPAIQFGQSDHMALLHQQYSHLAAGSPRLFMANDVIQRIYDGPWTAEALGDWVEAQRFLMVEDLSYNNFHAFGAQGKRMAILICTADVIAEYDYGRAELQKLAATTLANHFCFGRLDGVLWSSWVDRFGIVPQQYPYLLVYDARLELYFRNDTHARLIQDAMKVKDADTSALMASYLWQIVEGQEKELALGLKGRLNKFTKEYFPSMLGYLEEMQVLLLLTPVAVIGLAGVLVFWCIPADGADAKKVK